MESSRVAGNIPRVFEGFVQVLSSFGKIATELRGQLGLTDEEFAALVGVTVEEVEELEQMRAPCTREMVGRYSRVLGLQPGSAPARDLADAAAESNRRRMDTRRYMGDDKLMALLARHGNDLSETVKAQINRIIADEIAGKSRAPESSAPDARAHPRLTPVRLADLVLLSEEVRARFAAPDDRLSATTLLELAVEQAAGLQVELLSQMPLFAPDASVVTAGQTIFVETGFWTACATGARNVGNHILLHEYAHHVLHTSQIAAQPDGFLPPHALANQSLGDAREAVAVGGYESADSLELEADFFAVLLAVPWAKLAEVAIEDYKSRFLVRKLARDYGACWPVMDRLVRYMRMDVARDRIREALYRQNRIDHPFLLLI